MTDISINGISHRPVSGISEDSLSPERLRTIVQESHLNFLFGAGTPSSFFGLLGNVEDALTELADSPADDEVKVLVRASIHAYFFDSVLVPNLKIIERHADAEPVLTSYAKFLRTVNRILLERHSSILAKQANVFTTKGLVREEVTYDLWCSHTTGKDVHHARPPTPESFAMTSSAWPRTASPVLGCARSPRTSASLSLA